MKRSRVPAATLALVALVGCSSSASISTAVPTTVSGTLPPVTTAPVTATSSAATTSAPSVGWHAVDLAQIDGQVAPPCCGSDWYGVASPPLPADGAPLLDGDYFVLMEWPADPSQPLELHLYRFELCSVLPADTCEDPTDPTGMGVDRTTYTKVVVPLDAKLRVILTGFEGGTSMATAAEGTGTDLGALAVAVENAYAQVFIARSTSGESADAIVADVRAHPVAGFGPAADGSETSIQFEFGGAPPLLFQAPFDYTEPPTPGRGTDVLSVTSLGVRDGVMTIFIYAGYYS